MNDKKNKNEVVISTDIKKDEIISLLKRMIVILDEIAKNTFPGH